MSYKIVRTWEYNKHRLLAVPSTWEDNNILKYPRKNVTKYLKIGTSVPEHDWKHIKCDVKRRELPSYDTAEYVLQEMIKHTDTEDDITNSATTSKQTKPELNLNIIADDIVNVYPNIQQNVRNPNTFQESSVTYHHDVVLKQKNTNANTVGSAAENLNSELSYDYILPMCSSETNVNVENLEMFITGQNTLLTNQIKILEQLNSIQNVQTTMIQKIASLSVQLDHAMVQINNLPQNIQVTPLSACKFSPTNTAFNIKPIETVQQLDELELELSNGANRQQKKELYSVIFAGGKGIDCAYTLADVLFSRKFLCQCSWSGGSRGNNEAKIAWKAYKNILSFFWEMVNSWDNKYTVSQNVEFFQSILKNAKKRNMAKKERASTSRKRTKRSKNQSVNDKIESDEEETSATTAKKAKIEKKQIEKKENNGESSSKQYIDRKGVVIEEKRYDTESTKTSDSIIEEIECSIEEKDQEKRNDYEPSENVDSNIDEKENIEEEDEDHEREGDTSNDEESSIDSDGPLEKNYIIQNKLKGEQENNKEKMNCPNSSITQNKIKNLDEREENEKNTYKKNKVEKSAIFEENANTYNKNEKEKIDRNENMNYSNSTIKHDETMDNESEKTTKENEEDTLKEINKEKTYGQKNVSNSINVTIAEKNDKLEENLNLIIGENREKDNDRENEKVHGTIKLDSDFTNKENKNIVENQKKEKKRDRGPHYKSKKYMKKSLKETIITKREK